MPKPCFLFTLIVSRSSLDFEGSSACKLEPNWLSWAPRTLPKAFKIQFFGHMCPRCFSRGSKVTPKGSQGGPRSRFSEHFRWIWEPFFVIFGCENWLSQPTLQTSYVLAEWRHHLKGTYWQTSSHMSKEGRRYVRSTQNLMETIASMKTRIPKKFSGPFWPKNLEKALWKLREPSSQGSVDASPLRRRRLNSEVVPPGRSAQHKRINLKSNQKTHYALK